ncbi:MAG: hypothetical protein KA006_01650, partial [Neisseria sp.]|nr:hypothetical protein [Neisseria sp.]
MFCEQVSDSRIRPAGCFQTASFISGRLKQKSRLRLLFFPLYTALCCHSATAAPKRSMPSFKSSSLSNKP